MCMHSLTVYQLGKKHEKPEKPFNNLEQQSNHHNLFASLSLNVLRCKKQTLYIQTIKVKNWTMLDHVGPCWPGHKSSQINLAAWSSPNFSCNWLLIAHRCSWEDQFLEDKNAV